MLQQPSGKSSMGPTAPSGPPSGGAASTQVFRVSSSGMMGGRDVCEHSSRFQDFYPLTHNLPTPQHTQQTQHARQQQERVAFTPHPKTLTMAGDYEYFAAQGHHPLAFALAELVDNAIRATKGNGG